MTKLIFIAVRTELKQRLSTFILGEKMRGTGIRSLGNVLTAHAFGITLSMLS